MCHRGPTVADVRQISEAYMTRGEWEWVSEWVSEWECVCVCVCGFFFFLSCNKNWYWRPRTQSQTRYICLPTTSIFVPVEFRNLTQEQSASESCQTWLTGQEVQKFSFRFISSSCHFINPVEISSHNGPSSRVSSLCGTSFVSEDPINRTVATVLGAT